MRTLVTSCMALLMASFSVCASDSTPGPGPEQPCAALGAWRPCPRCPCRRRTPGRAAQMVAVATPCWPAPVSPRGSCPSASRGGPAEALLIQRPRVAGPREPDRAAQPLASRAASVRWRRPPHEIARRWPRSARNGIAAASAHAPPARGAPMTSPARTGRRRPGNDVLVRPPASPLRSPTAVRRPGLSAPACAASTPLASTPSGRTAVSDGRWRPSRRPASERAFSAPLRARASSQLRPVPPAGRHRCACRGGSRRLPFFVAERVFHGKASPTPTAFTARCGRSAASGGCVLHGAGVGRGPPPPHRVISRGPRPRRRPRAGRREAGSRDPAGARGPPPRGRLPEDE